MSVYGEMQRAVQAIDGGALGGVRQDIAEAVGKLIEAAADEMLDHETRGVMDGFVKPGMRSWDAALRLCRLVNGGVV